MQVEGVYTVQNLGRHRIVSELADGSELQSNKLAYLVLDDGSQVRLGARPDDELALEGQKVVASGSEVADWPPPGDPRAAQVNAKPTLLQITSVKPV